MRLFVALDLPLTLREALAHLAGGLLGARWVPPSNLHLTLRFVGELPAYRAEEIDLALSALRAPAFTLSVTGAGSFAKSGRATSVWIGVERCPGLEHLQGKIETALQRAGVEAERRRFQPHITLAGLDGVSEPELAAWIGARNLFRAPPVTIEHFVLFSSQLGKDHPVYTAEAEYPLT